MLSVSTLAENFRGSLQATFRRVVILPNAIVNRANLQLLISALTGDVQYWDSRCPVRRLVKTLKARTVSDGDPDSLGASANFVDMQRKRGVRKSDDWSRE